MRANTDRPNPATDHPDVVIRALQHITPRGVKVIADWVVVILIKNIGVVGVTVPFKNVAVRSVGLPDVWTPHDAHITPRLDLLDRSVKTRHVTALVVRHDEMDIGVVPQTAELRKMTGQDIDVLKVVLIPLPTPCRYDICNLHLAIPW